MMPKPRLPLCLLAAGALAGFLLWKTAGRAPEKTAVPRATATTVGNRHRDGPVVAGAVKGRFVVPDEVSPPQVQATSEAPTPAPGNWASTLRELGALATRDPKAALVQVGEIGEAEEQQAALKAVCSVIARNDPALALAAAWHFELGKLGGLAELRALETLAQTWAVRDPEAALAWMAREPQDKAGLRDYVTKGIAAAVSQDSREGAALLIAEDMSDNYPRFEAAATLAGERSDKVF